MLPMILMVIAAVLFFMAFCWSVNPSPRYNLIAGGLFFWLLSDIIIKYPLLK